MDQPEPRRVPSPLRPWLGKRWVQALLVVAVFAWLAVVFMVTSARHSDGKYEHGCVDGAHNATK